MVMDETLEEPEEVAPKQVSALVRVLSYDDLLDPQPGVYRLAGRKRPIRIGRGDDPEDLAFPDPWMSSEHASIKGRGGADVLVDAGSRNKTYVNGRAMKERRLADGDLIEIGHTAFVYRRVDEQLLDALGTDGIAFGPTKTLCADLAAVARDLSRIARSPESVLVLGPTGAGKEIAAAMIHAASGRPGPLVAVDCGAIPEALFEATMFGHERGAFTGASEPKIGEIERANGGTLFLDEIGNLPAPSQAKLLRVIETGVVTSVGGSARAVDVRWVAATNRDIVDDEGFRGDLLRRVGGYVARLPAVSKRREDLGVLSAYLLAEAGISSASMAAPAARAFFSGPFDGNIRELKSALRTAALLADGEPIDRGHLPDAGAVDAEPEPTAGDADAITAALEATSGNVVQAAKKLGTHPRQLYRWIKQFELDLDRFRQR